MKNWLKYGILGVIIGAVIGIIYNVTNSFIIIYFILKITWPLSFLYDIFIQITQSMNITLIEAIPLFYIFSLIVEGFIIGLIIGLIIEPKKKK